MASYIYKRDVSLAPFLELISYRSRTSYLVFFAFLYLFSNGLLNFNTLRYKVLDQHQEFSSLINRYREMKFPKLQLNCVSAASLRVLETKGVITVCPEVNV